MFFLFLLGNRLDNAGMKSEYWIASISEFITFQSFRLQQLIITFCKTSVTFEYINIFWLTSVKVSL